MSFWREVRCRQTIDPLDGDTSGRVGLAASSSRVEVSIDVDVGIRESE